MAPFTFTVVPLLCGGLVARWLCKPCLQSNYACLAGVIAGHVHLYWLAGNTICDVICQVMLHSSAMGYRLLDLRL